MISEETVQRIKDAARIEDVVGDYVHLIRRGRNYMGLCPFHNERTPSFSVNTERNFCYCFSCKKGGSPINFLIEKEGITYQDALRRLAARYGIEIEEEGMTEEAIRNRSRRESMYVANEWAMSTMHKWLTDTQQGRTEGLSYIYHRGITDEALHTFRLGFCLSGEALEKAARKEGHNLELLEELGLLRHNERGYYTPFAGRIIYPIINSAGKVVAFGGRTLRDDKKVAKYVNSPESEIYKKSNELYGIYQARSSVKKLDRCFLVEGYMDVIGMWQSGMTNVVSSSGTALTDNQIALIKRFTHNVTLIYDGDVAGIKAALRGIDMMLAAELDTKVLLLPDGQDPDDFSRNYTPEQFEKYVEANAKDFITYKANVLMGTGLTDPGRKAAAARSMVETLACIPRRMDRIIYVKECARLMDLNEDELCREADRAALARRSPSHRLTPAPAPVNTDRPAALPVPDTAMTAPSPQLAIIERKLTSLCIRFAMLPLSPDPQTEEEEMTVIDYVVSTLKAEGLSLHDSRLAAVMEALGELRPRFMTDRNDYEQHIAEECGRIHAEKFDEIRRQGGSVSDLERAEREAEQELDKLYYERMNTYCAAYAATALCSHADDNVRRTSTELIMTRHQLSKYHRKTGRIIDDHERRDVLVRRTLAELREYTLELEKSSLIAALKTASTEESPALLDRLATLLSRRNALAISNGDRTILPP